MAARLAPWLAVAIALYAGALRFEALVGRYWHADAPRWAQEARDAITHLRPGQFVQEPNPDPYAGDPYGYLRFAREPRGFYDAHGREPVFVFATRLGLLVTQDHDVGISFASAAFSTASVLATYWLGAIALSRFAGLLAAFLLAVEWFVVRLSVEGWRDDAFGFFVLASAAALVRLGRNPTRGSGVAAGVTFGLACLTRLTSLSFLLPGLLAALVGGAVPRAARVRAGLWAAAALAAVLGPYLLACAIAYGDPLYAINVHTLFYRSRAGMPTEQAWNVAEYLAQSRRPWSFLETGALGLTSYPFLNKWQGFEDWATGLGVVLRGLALAGALASLWTRVGRLLVIVTLTSLLPYAWTWDVPGGAEWRFTAHAYPFYLLFAAHAAERAFRGVGALARGGAARGRALRAGATLAAAALLLAAIATWGIRAVHARVVAESIRAGAAARIEAGFRDARFFLGGWYPPLQRGNIGLRYSRGREAVIALPLTAATAYGLTLRVQPFAHAGAPPQVLRVALDGTPLASFELVWNERRMGAYDVEVPAAAVRPGGDHRLELSAAWSVRAGSVDAAERDLDPDWDVAFSLWYVGIAPRPAGPR